MSKFKSKALRLSALCTVSALAFAAQGIATAQTSDTVQTDVQTQDFDIPAQPLGRALAQFGEQADVMIFAAADQTRGKTSAPVSGSMTSYAALSGLLQGTSLEPAIQADGSFAIAQATPPTEENDDAPVETQQAEVDESEGNGEPAERQVATLEELRDPDQIAADEEAAKENRGLAEFVVMDTITVRGKNVGVRRFEDDPQPYVIFNSDDIEASLATNLEDFLRTRLPQNTQANQARQFTAFDSEIPGNVSTIDLRGLGQDETLVLINGRRAPRVSLGNNFRQADLNGIPLGSIERIEILPATASGIYGGGATGGVINIITRRDFVGGEVRVEYGNTFDTDVADRRIEASLGFPLEGGKTRVLLTGSFSDSNDMLARDRSFAQESRDLLRRNDPDAFANGPLASTPNIRSFFGDLEFLDGTSLGSDITSVPLGYAGISSDGGQALIDNAGQFNFDLPETFDGLGQRIIQSPKTESVTLSVNRQFTDKIEAFVDASIYRNEGQFVSASLPNNIILFPGQAGNPFNNFVFVTFPAITDGLPSSSLSETVQLIGGASWEISEDWTASFDYNWSRSRFESESSFEAFNDSSSNGISAAIASGDLDIFQDVSAFPLDLSAFKFATPTRIRGPRDTVLNNYAFRLAGTPYELPAGPVNLNFLAERRTEQVEASFTDRIASGSVPPGEFETVFTPEREQNVDSLYVEAWVPIFSDQTNTPFAKSLDLQLAVRYDSYETRSPFLFAEAILENRSETPPVFDEVEQSFSSTDYTVGLRYQPVEDVVLRASYATGFVPPSVTQIFPIVDQNTTLFALDPRRPGAPLPLGIGELRQLGNPDLRPEESESWSAGFIVTPSFLPGFRFSADYTLIEKTDEISGISNADLFNLEDQFPDRIVRAPLTPEEEALGYTGGEILLFDASLINVANSTSESFDFQLDQEIDTNDFGNFRFYGIATYTNEVSQQILPESEIRDRVGFEDGPLEWRANLGIDWTSASKEWVLGWNAQFYDDYLVYRSTDSDSTVERTVLREGRESIPSETYHDVSAIYRPSVESGRFAQLLEGTEFRIGIQNVFDKKPTVRPATGPFDLRGQFSAYGDIRMRRYTVSVRKSF